MIIDRAIEITRNESRDIATTLAMKLVQETFDPDRCAVVSTYRLVWQVTNDPECDSRNWNLINGLGQFNYIIIDSFSMVDTFRTLNIQCARTKHKEKRAKANKQRNCQYSQHDLIIIIKCFSILTSARQCCGQVLKFRLDSNHRLLSTISAIYRMISIAPSNLPDIVAHIRWITNCLDFRLWTSSNS